MTKPISKKIFYYNIIGYFLLAAVSTFWWAKNWLTYEKFKGDEFFFLAEYLSGLTILFYLVQFLFIRKLKFLLLLLLPFVTIFTTFIFGFFLLLISGMGGTPSQTIYIYGIGYLLTNIFFSMLVLIHLTKAEHYKEIASPNLLK
jgi:hypothetical protein